MKVVFLASASHSLRWFQLYYTRVFPEGRKKAEARFVRMQITLAAAPLIGGAYGDRGSRKYSIPRTPFSVIYRVRSDRVEILRVIDQRAERVETP